MAATEHFDNDAVARAICERREFEGQRFEPGTYVAIAGGRVIGVGKSFKEADSYLSGAGLEPGDGMVCEVAELTTDVIRCERPTCP